MQILRIIGVFLVIVSLGIIAVCMFRRNEPFFNLNAVFRRHFGLFKDCKGQYWVFYFLPAVFSLGLVFLYIPTENLLTELSVVLGIVLSVLLTVLSIISSFDFSDIIDQTQKKKGREVVEDTINSITFNTVLCVFLLMYNMILIVAAEGDFSWIPFELSLIKGGAAIIVYYLFSVICLTFLLIVKQMTKIIQFNLAVKRRE